MILIDFGIICREQTKRSFPRSIPKVRFQSHIRRENSEAMYDEFYHFEDADKLTGIWYFAWLTDEIFLEQSFFDIADKGSTGTNIGLARTIWDCWNHIGQFDNVSDDTYVLL